MDSASGERSGHDGASAELTPELLDRLGQIVCTAFCADYVPGISWAVIGPNTEHIAGLGALVDDTDRASTGDGIFRVASMTKCFTAVAVLQLRDAGLVRLDDPVTTYLPAGQAISHITADAPPRTLRHLLTMTGGLATDDPWGDRQMPMPVETFDSLVSGGGIGAMVGPGEVYEYSNTGYALLGRVISAVTGQEYADVVTERILVPLGMSDSGFYPDTVPEQRRARGHVRHEGVVREEPWVGYGAYSAMAGLHTTARDLSRFVRWMLDADDARDGEDGPVLSRASRREMQRTMVQVQTRIAAYDGRRDPASGGYGFGLAVWEDEHLGRMVGHSGGLPGFGSHMQWHPGTGLGVIAMGNRTYVNMRALADRVLRTAVDAVGVAATGAAPRTLAAAAELDGVLAAPETLDDVAAQWFADNMDLDVPRDVRHRALVAMLARHGSLARVEDRPDESESPAHLRRWFTGERGLVRVDVLMSPQEPSMVQGWRVVAWDDAVGSLRVREHIRDVDELSDVPVLELVHEHRDEVLVSLSAPSLHQPGPLAELHLQWSSIGAGYDAEFVRSALSVVKSFTARAFGSDCVPVVTIAADDPSAAAGRAVVGTISGAATDPVVVRG